MFWIYKKIYIDVCILQYGCAMQKHDSLPQPLFTNSNHKLRCAVCHSPIHGNVTSVSLTLPVPVLQVHILGVPPAEVLFVGQAAHTPKEG